MTIGIANGSQIGNVASGADSTSLSPGFPNFIAGTNNFIHSNMGWFTTGLQAQGQGDFITIGNDTETRVMIMQLAVETNERVRGTLNIGVHEYYDGVFHQAFYTGQTFYGVPGPGGIAVMGVAGAVLRTRRKREKYERNTKGMQGF